MLTRLLKNSRCHVPDAHRLPRADEMLMIRWSQRVKDSIHVWEMEMKMLLSDMRFDADDVRFVLVLEGQFTCKPESRSQKVALCVVKVNSQSVVLGTWQIVRVTTPGRCDVLSLIVNSRLTRVEEGELVTHAASEGW